jgi:predicted amidophosphoribosyltransferase
MPDNPSQAISSMKLNCPACGTGFRGDEICPRCGTSLHWVMLLTARAWALRQISRTHLQEGDLEQALKCEVKAVEIHRKQS